MPPEHLDQLNLWFLYSLRFQSWKRGDNADLDALVREGIRVFDALGPGFYRAWLETSVEIEAAIRWSRLPLGLAASFRRRCRQARVLISPGSTLL